MTKYDLLRVGGAIFRVLEMREESALVIDCLHQTMPRWMNLTELESSATCAEEDLLQEAGITLPPVEELQADRRRIAYEHYTMIAGVLPYIGNETARSNAIQYAAEQHQVTLQTIRRILCRFLAFQSISVLAPQEPNPRELTEDEKNFRWALNKFFYTKRKNNLPTAYAYMLKERYCDDEGNLLPDIPPFHRFKYFYYKTRNMETFYISRNGMKDYKKNHRPLVGGTVQDYAGNVGMAFADSTMLDVFLVDEAGNLIARPLLACAVDVYSGLIMGYALSLEGGVYSLRGLMQSIIEDKVAHCKRFGIEMLNPEQRRIAYQRYTVIAGVLPYIGEERERTHAIQSAATLYGRCEQTIRATLCRYLVFQSIGSLAPRKHDQTPILTQDQKNMRWALNKFYYTPKKLNLTTAYTMMLKEKYCDEEGSLLSEHPSIHQFRYFYRKHRKIETQLISRNGIKDYQRNSRPLLGDGVQEFAPAPGIAMLDSTILDIFLADDGDNLIGRPILTAAVDAYSSMCLGYALTFEGGVYSLRCLMQSILVDKMKWCKQFGIYKMIC